MSEQTQTNQPATNLQGQIQTNVQAQPQAQGQMQQAMQGAPAAPARVISLKDWASI